MNDTPLMFQAVNDNSDKVSDSVAFFEADYTTILENGSFFGGLLTIEKCEFGKNINLKYQEFFSQKNKFGRKIEDFYCFSNTGNFSLFFIPDQGMNYINLHMLYKKNNEYTPEQLHTLIVSESDLILHDDKDNPISKYYIYQTISGYSSKEYIKAFYNFQFVKYETDDGYFYPNNKILNGMSFSDMTYYRAYQYDEFYKNLEENNQVGIGTITFGVNRANFDHYKRSYQRIPSLLADVMSVISLLFEIGRQLSNIFCNKKMSTDLISYLLPKKKKDSLIRNSNDITLKLKNKGNNNMSISERKNMEKELIDNKGSTIDILNKNNQIQLNNNLNNIKRINIREITNKKDSKNNNKIKILNNINYYNIMMSYLFCKNKKTELINLCHNIINEDMCIERILKRMYDLENLYNYCSNEENSKIKLIKNNRFKEIKKCINEINNELKDEKCDKEKTKRNDDENNKKENILE
jgi:hypothetical protein